MTEVQQAVRRALVSASRSLGTIERILAHQDFLPGLEIKSDTLALIVDLKDADRLVWEPLLPRRTRHWRISFG